MLKVKEKISGCFRTKNGTDDFVAIRSYTGTALKQGISAFTAIKNAFLGCADSTIYFEATE